MKIYLAKRSFGPDRWFQSQQDLLKFLIEADRSESISVMTIDADPESTLDRNDAIRQLQDQIQRDSAISAVLGDEYADAAARVISLFEELAKRCPWDNGFTERGRKVHAKLTTCERTKQDFGRIVKLNAEYLLYNVSDTVEWYSALLDAYGFRKMGEICRLEQLAQGTRYFRYDGCRTPQRMIDAFEMAKRQKKESI